RSSTQLTSLLINNAGALRPNRLPGARPDVRADVRRDPLHAEADCWLPGRSAGAELADPHQQSQDWCATMPRLRPTADHEVRMNTK
ncbi:hypothetical protein OSI78_25440, partial [Mycobacterium ulcerans]